MVVSSTSVSFFYVEVSLSSRSFRRFFLSRMTTLLNPPLTLSYLAYLGYPHSSLSLSYNTTSATPPLASASTSSFPFSSSQSSSTFSKLLPTTSALQITKPRRPSRRKPNVRVERNCFLAYVLGASGSGKTSLLRSFVGKGFNEEDEMGGGGGRVRIGTGTKGLGEKTESLRGKGKSVVNCVEEGGGERYLVVSCSDLLRFSSAVN